MRLRRRRERNTPDPDPARSNSPVPTPISGRAGSVVRVGVVGPLRARIAELNALGAPRFEFTAHLVGESILVTVPISEALLATLHHQAPGRPIVIWDREEAARPDQISRALAGHADLFVTNPGSLALVAHLDALIRRSRDDRPTG